MLKCPWVMVIAFICDFHIYVEVTYKRNAQWKCSDFDGHWKMATLQQYGIQEMICQAKKKHYY